jgi:hypothetical protein
VLDLVLAVFAALAGIGALVRVQMLTTLFNQ